MQRWLNDEISDVQTGAFLSALRAKGCTGTELCSMAEELLNVCELPVARPNFYLVDTWGTGGDGANTFNISTAVAFVAASCGVKIAKHGNKSASGKVGSADVLLNLGLNLNCSLEKVINAVSEIGITFLFAPVWHKSLIKLAPLRKTLGIRTVFNQLGPLVNPLRPNAQVLGVASEDLLNPMGSALLKMGMNRAIVVHGSGCLDEASLQGENKLVFIDNGELRFSELNIFLFNLKIAKKRPRNNPKNNDADNNFKVTTVAPKSLGKLGKESSGVSKLQLLVPVCLFIFASKLGSLDIFPAMIGFFIYKPSLILYFSRS